LQRHSWFQTLDDAGSRISAAQPEAFRLETDGHSHVGFRFKLKTTTQA
jgi:hypothetical protein